MSGATGVTANSHGDGHTGLHMGCTRRQKIRLELRGKGSSLDLYTQGLTQTLHPSPRFCTHPKAADSLRLHPLLL